MDNHAAEKGAFQYFLDAFRKYAVFQGRSRRKEYWYFVLFTFIIGVCLEVLDFVFFKNLFVPFAIIYDLAVFIPSLAVTVRRLHDIGKSGWWYLIFLIPIIGAILWIVYLATDSIPGDNQYGTNPKNQHVSEKMQRLSKKCANCGFVLQNDSSFCPECGKAVR